MLVEWKRLKEKEGIRRALRLLTWELDRQLYHPSGRKCRKEH